MMNKKLSAINPQKEKNSFKAWLLASRPRTLPISLPPIIVGTALASQQVEQLNWMLVGCVLLCSLGIQIGTNLVNDALDFKKGADTTERLGPQRMTQSGLLSFREVLAVGFICFAFAFLCGIPLMMAGGWPLAFIIFISIACGYFYTGGPWPLAYTGLSDGFILIFFGWVSTSAIYYLQTSKIDFSCFVAATQIGLLAIVPHAINNLRDYETDARVNKRTFTVRFGQNLTCWEITFFSLLPFVLGLRWIIEGRIWMTVLPVGVLPLIVRNLKAIWQTKPSLIYNEFLARSVLYGLFFGCLLALGIFLT